MNIYNWQKPDWPNFTFLALAEAEIVQLAEKSGIITGIVKSLPKSLQVDTIIEIMVAEALKTSEIESEWLNRDDVMSSIKNNIGLNEVPAKVNNQKAEGIARLMVDVRKTFNELLSHEKLFEWHTMVMAGSTDVVAGQWRTHAEPMQVISGAMGKQKVHFEAPPSNRIANEMGNFISWFNQTAPAGEKPIAVGAVRSAIAHLYFESIHPFEDGNGRIGRAIAEKALSQGLGRPVMLSLSRTIEANKKSYYQQLEQAQRSNDVTEWVAWFIKTILAAQSETEQQIDFTLRKTKFFDTHKSHVSERQLKVIRRMLTEGPSGFKGGMNASKYGSLTSTSKATATRDLSELLQKNVLKLSGTAGGRSTSYELNI